MGEGEPGRTGVVVGMGYPISVLSILETFIIERASRKMTVLCKIIYIIGMALKFCFGYSATAYHLITGASFEVNLPNLSIYPRQNISLDVDVSIPQ